MVPFYQLYLNKVKKKKWSHLVFNVKASLEIPRISNQVPLTFSSVAISSPYSSVPNSCSQPRSHYYEFLQLPDVPVLLQFICVWIHQQSCFLYLCRDPTLNAPVPSSSFPELSLSLTHASTPL